MPGVQFLSMNRASIVALVLAAALPACAQRGAGHVAFAAHNAPAPRAFPAFRSGIAPVPMMHGYARPLIRSTRAYPAQPLPRFAQRPLRYPTIAPPAAPPFYQRNHTYKTAHREYRNRVIAYPTSVVGVFPADLVDDSWDDPTYSSQPYASQPAAPQQPGDSEYQNPGYPDYYAGYPPEYQPHSGYDQPAPAPVAVSAPAPETVTLIFNNGQPPEQIQNYLATRTTLTVIDGNHHRDIPVADLDLPATVKANHDAGVDFQLPPGSH